MRHGQPLLAPGAPITAARMGEWIGRYNLSRVNAENVPSANVRIANSALTIVTSTSVRAISSVEALGQQPSLSEELFCEAELPYGRWRFLRLPPAAWAGFFRLLWFLGYSNECEALGAARKRAKAAANRLVSLAAKGPVLLVGHGIMNRLIAKELISMGWSGPSNPSNAHWGCGVYRSGPATASEDGQ